MNTTASPPSDGTENVGVAPDAVGSQPSMAASLFVIGSMVVQIYGPTPTPTGPNRTA